MSQAKKDYLAINTSLSIKERKQTFLPASM